MMLNDGWRRLWVVGTLLWGCFFVWLYVADPPSQPLSQIWFPLLLWWLVPPVVVYVFGLGGSWVWSGLRLGVRWVRSPGEGARALTDWEQLWVIGTVLWVMGTSLYGAVLFTAFEAQSRYSSPPMSQGQAAFAFAVFWLVPAAVFAVGVRWAVYLFAVGVRWVRVRWVIRT